MLDRYFLFKPEREVLSTPADVGLRYRDVFFRAADGVLLHGWYVPAYVETRLTWLWCHGNAGNIGHRVDNLAMLHRQMAANIFIFDYRGYGLSEGVPSERGTYQDAEAALSFLRDQMGVSQEDLVLFGRSLGSAVALEMALRHRARCLVLESPFTSIAELARRSSPVLSRLFPPMLVLRSRYDNLAKIDKVDLPLMVVHGDRDQVVPPDMGRRLYERAPSPKRLYIVPGADHNDVYLVGGGDYFKALREFCENPVEA